MNKSLKFIKRQHADVLTVGDEYEEFLPSGVTVLKRITTVDGEEFTSEVVKVLELYKPAGPGYRRPREFKVRKTVWAMRDRKKKV